MFITSIIQQTAQKNTYKNFRKIKDETIWLTQKAMAELFGIDKSGISRHLAKIFESSDLD